MQEKKRFLIELTEERLQLLRFYCDTNKITRSDFFSALFETRIKGHQKEIEGVVDTVNQVIKKNFTF